MKMYIFFRDVKGYSEEEIEETLIRMENGMDVPDQIRKDLAEYYYSESGEVDESLLGGWI